uniref:Proline rich 35 n=1 Tax=Cyprinodon variegatus TaxID=28743 RepID=A0A3Q2DM20_CYPVA
MSKDEACKVTSAGKHKERKPKKPHYIPRPWGKPYNYKCFQCPFTCMEKSHLYNHMKYSLCKNSLSLLIESDWPYKKGNILHPDQLRPFQQAHGLHTTGKDELEQVTSNNRRVESPEVTAKRSKQPESELLMADMLSFEDQLLRAQEGAQPRVNGSIPCYPPPPNLVDYQDPSGLNLSVLGVGYPISPSLFSYMNSAIPAAASSLPFLASAAQLMHPASSSNPDRALIPPRLYYPFLCEHTFGPVSTQADASKSLKHPSSGADASSGFQPKVGLWKVPALRAGNTMSPAGWLSPQRDSPDEGYRVGDKIQAAAKEGKATSVPTTKRSLYPLLLKPPAKTLLRPGRSKKALQEYQEAERKISHLENEDHPAQQHLWEHLNKIRNELSHIHQALEHTASQSDGPLDLSVKRESMESPCEQTMREDGKHKASTRETEEEDEEVEENEGEKEEEEESERRLMKASLEKQRGLPTSHPQAPSPTSPSDHRRKKGQLSGPEETPADT